MSATDELRAELDERGVEWKAWDGTHPITVWHDETYLYEFIEYRLVNGAKQVNGCLSDNDGHCELTIKVFNCTPAQAIAATLGSDRLAFLEEKVRLQGDYIIKLTKEYDALFAQSCEAATRHAGQIDAMQRKLEAATLGRGTCHLKPWEMERDTGFYDSMECDCGYVADVADLASWHFCPSCGRQNVGVDE